jgi:hypothetical protein
MHKDHDGDHVAVLQQLLNQTAINPVHPEIGKIVTQPVNHNKLIGPCYP